MYGKDPDGHGLSGFFFVGISAKNSEKIEKIEI
jgi:hypothetical protein